MKRIIGLASIALIALTGCSSVSAESTPPEPPEPTVEMTVEPTEAETVDTSDLDEATDNYNHALFRADLVAAGIYLNDDELADSLGDNACAAFDSVGVDAAMDTIAKYSPDQVEMNLVIAPMAVDRLCPQHSMDMNTYLANH